jgi:hypothetical protein
MSAELELAKAKIKSLEERLKTYQKMEEHLVPLPNGDLHRGFKHQLAEANIDVDTEVIPETMGNPLDRAMAMVLKAAKDGHPLTCIWCGLQWGIPGPQNLGAEQQIREHLKKDHPSVVEGHDKIVPELLMANLEEAKERLKVATQKE